MIDYVGKRVGHYYLERLLGKGGFAHVYLGIHIDLKTPAAVKVLTQLTSSDIEQFRKEAQTIAWLVHPNIVRVFDFGVGNGLLPYLVMDYMPGGTLRSHHSKGENYPCLQWSPIPAR